MPMAFQVFRKRIKVGDPNSGVRFLCRGKSGLYTKMQFCPRQREPNPTTRAQGLWLFDFRKADRIPPKLSRMIFLSFRYGHLNMVQGEIWHRQLLR